MRSRLGAGGGPHSPHRAQSKARKGSQNGHIPKRKTLTAFLNRPHRADPKIKVAKRRKQACTNRSKREETDKDDQDGGHSAGQRREKTKQPRKPSVYKTIQRFKTTPKRGSALWGLFRNAVRFWYTLARRHSAPEVPKEVTPDTKELAEAPHPQRKGRLTPAANPG